MKITTIVYPVILMMLVGVPVTRYYASTPDINACVLDYVDNLEESDYKGYMYDINGVKHIEPLNSSMNESLKQYRIGETSGCLMSSDNLFNDMNNTFYCTVTYLIRNAPVSDKLKEPLGILKDE
ncbi:MAG: hypothetical protein PHS49_05495 [Candidatus Gracilibacteria bacterium]|nr:hypothetical protein [Candidatus Gracilibacteria bacterium]